MLSRQCSRIGGERVVIMYSSYMRILSFLGLAARLKRLSSSRDVSKVEALCITGASQLWAGTCSLLLLRL